MAFNPESFLNRYAQLIAMGEDKRRWDIQFANQQEQQRISNKYNQDMLQLKTRDLDSAIELRKANKLFMDKTGSAELMQATTNAQRAESYRVNDILTSAAVSLDGAQKEGTLNQDYFDRLGASLANLAPSMSIDQEQQIWGHYASLGSRYGLDAINGVAPSYTLSKSELMRLNAQKPGLAAQYVGDAKAYHRDRAVLQASLQSGEISYEEFTRKQKMLDVVLRASLAGLREEIKLMPDLQPQTIKKDEQREESVDEPAKPESSALFHSSTPKTPRGQRPGNTYFLQSFTHSPTPLPY